MTRKKFLLPDFDACSVALFASLVFMGPQPGRAQTPLSPRPGLSAPREEPSEKSRIPPGLVHSQVARKRPAR